MTDDTEKDTSKEEFCKALMKLPVPVSCYSNGAICPWCGCLHETITFGVNACMECERPFSFGYPEAGWHEGKAPISWVNFPFKEFDAVGGKASALSDWKPNERLQRIYFEKTEEHIGVYADASKPN